VPGTVNALHTARKSGALLTVPGTVSDDCVTNRLRGPWARLSAASFDCVPRVPRSVLPDGIFHVYARGVAATAAPFPTDTDKEVMFDLLPQLRTRGVVVHAACVMSTHYHGIFEARRTKLSSAMQWLNWSYARWYNTAHELHGHVFSERFQTRLIDDETSLERRHDYVLGNPVRAGLCPSIEDWPWSFSRYIPALRRF
jgi:REP-associated tyrosine transposase